MVARYEIQYGGRPLIIEAGKVAEQANGAVMVRYGDTVVLATATAAKEPRPDIDFLPLTVDYEERLYAAGKIPGGFFKREGRPSEQAILTCRLTDRPIRPLFPKGFRNDVQIIVTALSADQENEPDILSIIGASAALTISDIPWEGPIGAAKVGLINGELVLNPTSSELTNSDLELVVAGTREAVVMVEAGARQVPEEKILEAIQFGHQALQVVVELQERMRAEIGKPKFTYPVFSLPEDLRPKLEEVFRDRLRDMIYQKDKTVRERLRQEIQREALAQFVEQYRDKDILAALEEIEKEIVRTGILERGERPDGRGLAEIRPIWCEVGVLPRTHGSGLFTRGQTQVLSIVTLGSISDEQIIEGLGLEETKRFMHHYNFPPFSVGEVRRLGAPGRREIGHGALAERALAPVIPPENEFPYTIRIVSEVLSSNGSTSMGSVCGSTLALMDAGVPIAAPVAGVAMGLVTGPDGKYAILTDIQGIEDHLGDMDFKVAGTRQGVTALQMDIKVKGLTPEIMGQALAQAREGRLFILDKMLEVIAEPRRELSPYAPRIFKTKIPVEKIGTLIGPGGRTVRMIQEQYHVKIDIEEDGSVFVTATDTEGAQKALKAIEALTKEVEVGQEYLGRVTRVTNMGAFVEILPGKEGLVRTSELAEYRVARPEDVVSVGDEIMVKVIEIDPQGRINLSRRAVLEATKARTAPQPPSAPAAARRAPAPAPAQGRPPQVRPEARPPRADQRRPAPGPGRPPERRPPGGPSGRPR